MITRFQHGLYGSNYKYIQRKYFDDAMRAKNEVIAENQRLRAELLGKEDALKRAVKVIAADIGDVEPVDQKARAAYVASASNFYSEILEKKLMHMIAQTREQLDAVFSEVPIGMDRAGYDNILRGTSNAFKLLMDYYEQLKGEHLSNITKETNQ